MKLTLLGTATAEGWPAPFCDCVACETARRRGGPNIRSRSGALIDDDFKIDWSADSVHHIQRLGRSLSRLRTLLFTHQHSDHIQPAELAWVVPPYTHTPPGQIDVYGNRQVLELIHAAWDPIRLNLVLHLLEPFQEITTSTGDKILPLPADHVEGALLLRIARGGKTLFYGHDSGLYPQETLNALARGPKLDIVLLDSTFGSDNSSNRGHMSIEGVIQMAEQLRASGCLNSSSQVIATHFSHNGGLLHEELVRAYLPHGIQVAFDGMVIDCG